MSFHGTLDCHQNQFSNYYKAAGVEPDIPKEQYDRIVRKHLVKRELTPKKNKIGTKDMRPGWEPHMNEMNQSD